MQFEKRLVALFKTFVERTLLQQIRKYNGSTLQWDRFSSLISQETINMGEVQAYVESFSPVQTLPTFEKTKPPHFLTKKQQPVSQSTSGSFASRTFGGQRARMTLLQKIDIEDSSDRKRQQFSYGTSSVNRTSNSVSTSYTLPSLDRLFRNFSENHNRIEAIVGSVYDGGYEAKPYH